MGSQVTGGDWRSQRTLRHADSNPSFLEGAWGFLGWLKPPPNISTVDHLTCSFLEASGEQQFWGDQFRDLFDLQARKEADETTQCLNVNSKKIKTQKTCSDPI